MDDFPKMFEEIGRLCSSWAYLEFLTERAIWGLLNIDKELGRVVTYSKDMRQLWSLLISEAGYRLGEGDAKLLKDINKRLIIVMKDRNIIVHGRLTAIMSRKPEVGVYDVVDVSRENFIATWSVFKGEHAGKRFPASHNAVSIVRNNIMKLCDEMQTFNKTHNFVADNHPSDQLQILWPTAL
jgi:hypothetical protein